MKKLMTVLIFAGAAAAGGTAESGEAAETMACRTMYDNWKMSAGGSAVPGHGTDTPEGWWPSIGYANMSGDHTNEEGFRVLDHVWGRKGDKGHFVC